MGRITLITKQHYMKVVKQRKTNVAWVEKGVFFRAVNGKFYKCDTEGPASVNEIYEFNKKLKEEKKEQTGLFDQNPML